MLINNEINQTFYRYNTWWDNSFKINNIIERPQKIEEVKSSFNLNKIIILTGLRRIGKTSLIKLIIQWLINTGTNPKNILYLSIDDYLLRNFSIHELIDNYRSIFKLSFDEKIYLFLDEITCKTDYEIEIKNIFDNSNVKLVISSSSASLLKSRKPYLTGRTITHILEPLNFDEYLNFKKINLSNKDSNLLQTYFTDYLKTGGIPEFVLTSSIEIIKELVDDIITKDIAIKNGLTNKILLQDFFILLTQRSGSIISTNKIAKILNISVDTASRYIKMFEEVYLINLMAKYGKPNKKILTAKKLYLPDTGLKNIFSDNASLGSLFENYIYLQIKKFSPYYINKNGIEIDFYIHPNTLIEVKYNNEITAQQQKLFDNFTAKNKLIINGFDDLEKLKNIS